MRRMLLARPWRLTRLPALQPKTLKLSRCASIGTGSAASDEADAVAFVVERGYSPQVRAHVRGSVVPVRTPNARAFVWRVPASAVRVPRVLSASAAPAPRPPLRSEDTSRQPECARAQAGMTPGRAPCRAASRLLTPCAAALPCIALPRRGQVPFGSKWLGRPARTPVEDCTEAGRPVGGRGGRGSGLAGGGRRARDRARDREEQGVGARLPVFGGAAVSSGGSRGTNTSRRCHVFGRSGRSLIGGVP
eukprot:scaffold1491_cov110-Isochrysis_galbana.AAC.1